MSDLIRTTSANLWVWRVIIFKALNNWFIVVGSSLTASNIAAHNAFFSERTNVILLALMAGAKALEGFMNQDIGQLKAQIAAALSDNTSMWQKALPSVSPPAAEQPKP